MSILVDESTKVISQGITGKVALADEVKGNVPVSVDAVSGPPVACKTIKGSLT